MKEMKLICKSHEWPYGAEDTGGPYCVWCELLRAEKLESQLTDLRKKVEGRWQKSIRDMLLTKLPDAKIDGAGYDSGYPLDVTLSEIIQAINFASEQAPQQTLFDKDAAEKLSMCGAEVEVLREKLRVAEEKIEQIATERDEAESAFESAFLDITGRSPEWSNHYGFVEAMDEIHLAKPTSNPIAERAVDYIRRNRVVLLEGLDRSLMQGSAEAFKELRAILSQLQEKPQ